MAFLVSPGVQVKEIDLTNVVPAVATSIGAIGGAFEKGPVSSVTNISSEEELVKIFGKPKGTGNQFETFFTAANFLQYSDSLQVVRAESAILNAGATLEYLFVMMIIMKQVFQQDKVLMENGLQELLEHMVTQSVLKSVRQQQHTNKS